MTKVKYIVLDNCHLIMFPLTLIHKNVATGTRKSCGRGTYLEVTGAGFVRLDDKGARCYGESESLNIPCNETQDNFLLHEQYGFPISPK